MLRLVVACALGLCPALAAAESSPWLYLQGERVQGQLQSDKAGRGFAGQLGLPLSKNAYVVAAGYGGDARFDYPGNPEEHYQTYAGGFGLHDSWGRAQGYGWLGYVQQRRRSSGGGLASSSAERDYGALLTLGVRIVAQSWLTIEPEMAAAHYSLSLHPRLGVRLLPHVWLLAGYNVGDLFGDSRSWSAGLRVQGNDSYAPPPKSRGVRPADQDDDVELVPGMTVTALRTLRLQVRPRFGAAETVIVPPGATLILQKTVENDFGGWWYVLTADGKEGWLRESELQ